MNRGNSKEGDKGPSPWCGICNRYRDLIQRWPRTAEILYRQLLVASLLLVTLVGGYCISTLEGPAEISNNDSFLRQAWFLRTIPIQEVTNALVGLPSTCLNEYHNLVEQQEQQKTSNGEETNNLVDVNSSTTFSTDYTPPDRDIGLVLGENYFPNGDTLWTDVNFTIRDLYGFVNSTFPRDEVSLPPLTTPALPPLIATNSSSNNSNNASTSITPDLEDYMAGCEQIAGEMLKSVVDFFLQVVRHDLGLLVQNTGKISFNWVRCTNATEGNPMEASVYKNQTTYFAAGWDADRNALYDQYVLNLGCHDYDNEFDNISSSIGNISTSTSSSNTTGTSLTEDSFSERSNCYWEATKRSVLEATGGKGCQANIGSSAWFWFTVMTTVGYGNFSPSTKGGRLLVWCFGWLSTIAFGGIMIGTALTYTALANDLFRRLNLKWLQRPFVASLFWGALSVLWIFIIAYRARIYWDERVPDFEYTIADSYWFSYITVLTVGLGDFVLQPQGMFITDVFQWSSMLLHGFIFLSSFLGKVGELLESCFPRQEGESLEYRLARTGLCHKGLNTPISKSLETLKGMVEDLDNGRSSTVIKTILSDAEKGEENTRQHHTYRTSFDGNHMALTPDGETIHHHRIKILTEKKKMLIRLLEETQSELVDRTNDEAFLDHLKAENEKNKTNGTVDNHIESPSLQHRVSRSMATVEDLQYEERVLESTLVRTRDTRTQLEEFESRGGNAKHTVNNFHQSTEEEDATKEDL